MVSYSLCSQMFWEHECNDFVMKIQNDESFRSCLLLLLGMVKNTPEGMLKKENILQKIWLLILQKLENYF